MFNSPSIIVGLEIGTSKVCAVVGEINDEGALNIVGLGQSRSRGVRKGEIVDPQQADLADTVNGNTERLNALLFTYMDYAAIGERG